MLRAGLDAGYAVPPPGKGRSAEFVRHAALLKERGGPTSINERVSIHAAAARAP